MSILLAFIIGFSTSFLGQVAADRVAPDKDNDPPIILCTGDANHLECKNVNLSK